MENTCVCCGRVIPEGSQVCHVCVAESLDDRKNVYMQLDCLECGAPLEVYYDGTRAGDPEPLLIRHCNNCGRDWESEWLHDMCETELRRKFWG